VAESTVPKSTAVLCLCSPSSRESAAERFLTSLLCAVKMSDFDLFGRERGVEAVLLEELEIRDERLLENAREVEDDISFAFVLDNCLTP
jgi:hypothetical protein